MEQYLEHCIEQLNANRLSELDLSGKNLTDTQIIRLAEALKHNQSLTTLNLLCNQFGATGAESLSAALKVNQTLITLYLSFNNLGVTGAKSLSEALKVNRTLTTLTLCIFQSKSNNNSS